ncbi:MAG: hypothetical protein J6T54_12435 [Fibrobacter sp.]|nr:hypothetical protein [Fibrobacter sp.]
MKFTTDIERYYFACAKKLHAETMVDFYRFNMKGMRKGTKKYSKEEERFYKYLHEENFWWNVIEYFEKKIDLSNCGDTFMVHGISYAR